MFSGALHSSESHGTSAGLTRAVTTVGVCDDRVHSVLALVLDRKLCRREPCHQAEHRHGGRISNRILTT